MMRKMLRSPLFAVALFVLAAGLLLTGSIGAVSAAPRTESGEFGAQVALSSIATGVTENGAVVSGDALMSDLLSRAGDDEFKIGKSYPEELAVTNTGTDAEYVRATVIRYWSDADGKAVSLDPSLIELGFVTGNGWTIDEGASTPERTVLYYASAIEPGETTPPFVDAVSVDEQVMYRATLTEAGYTYDYANVQFHVEVTADAVQTHSAEAAMTSAWGRTNQ